MVTTGQTASRTQTVERADIDRFTELESRWGPPVAIEGSAVMAPPETRAALGIS